MDSRRLLRRTTDSPGSTWPFVSTRRVSARIPAKSGYSHDPEQILDFCAVREELGAGHPARRSSSLTYESERAWDDANPTSCSALVRYHARDRERFFGA